MILKIANHPILEKWIAQTGRNVDRMMSQHIEMTHMNAHDLEQPSQHMWVEQWHKPPIWEW